MPEHHEVMHEEEHGFPWDTQLVYDVEPDVLGEYGETAETEFSKINHHYQQEIQSVILDSADGSIFSPEDRKRVASIDEYFHRLQSANLPEDRLEIFAKLNALYSETLPGHSLSITETPGWFPVTHEAKNYNLVYSNELILLVNSHIDLLKRTYTGPKLKGELAKFFKSIEGLPFFQQTSGRSQELPISKEWNIHSMIMDLKGALMHLDYLSIYKSETDFIEAKKTLAHLIGRLRQTLADTPTLLAEFNSELQRILEDRRQKDLRLEYSGRETDKAVAKRNEETIKILREKNIVGLLTNTDKYVVFMHRTSTTAAKIISDVGFATKYSIHGTATVSSSNEEEAVRVFLQRHRGDSAVVIFRVPRDIVSKIDDLGTLMQETYGTEENVSKSGVIPPSWILGYVTRSDTDFVPNAHFQDASYDRIKPVLRFS